MDAHFKSKSLKKATEVGEIPTSVAMRLSEALHKLSRAAHDIAGRDAFSTHFML
jgi:hypothetical protein